MTTRPYFASERLLPGPPFKGCRVSTIFHGYACATGNESALDAGRPKGKPALTRDLQRGWTGFRKGDPGDDMPDQGDVQAICAQMFPDLPVPTITRFSTSAPVRQAVEGGKAVSISLRLSVLTASSPLRKYTSADHQVLITAAKPGKLRIVDPMRPHDPRQRYTGIWVPEADVVKAAKAFGAFFVELFPIGKWTQEELRAAQLRQDKIRPLEDKVTALQRTNKKLDGRNSDLVAQNEGLVAELRQCQSTDAIRNAKASGWEGGLVAGIEALQTLRGKGPA